MKIPDFINKRLFEQAFTHKSYLNEAKDLPNSKQGKLASNERLEFLGDSILSFVVSNALYRNYPQYNEGVLTNIRSLLVNTKTLAHIAGELGFGKFLKLSKGEEEAEGRQNQSLLADCFESYLGALFLDQGLPAVTNFITQTLFPKMEEIVEGKQFKDPKSLLQEYTQAQNHTSPVYKVLQESGPSHAKTFTVGVYVKDILKGQGSGKSKQSAEEKAAKQALEKRSAK